MKRARTAALFGRKAAAVAVPAAARLAMGAHVDGAGRRLLALMVEESTTANGAVSTAANGAVAPEQA